MAYREKRFTSQDGLSLYYRDYGDPYSHNTPLLCLGGLTRNSKDFHGFARKHSVQRRVICPDYRGRGRSQYDREWRNYNPASYLMDIRHLMAVAGLHRVVVIGTSLGGILAMALGAAQPSALAGVVLNDIGPDIPAAGVGPIIDYMRKPPVFDSLDQAVDHIRASFPDFPAQTDAEWRTIAESTYQLCKDGKYRFDWDPDIVRPFLDGAAPPMDLWPLFRSLKHVPVLVLRGLRSDILSAETFERMEEEMPGLNRVEVPDVGHPPGLHEPESRSAVEAFLAGIS